MSLTQCNIRVHLPPLLILTNVQNKMPMLLLEPLAMPRTTVDFPRLVLVFTKDLQHLLKDTLTRFWIFWQGPSSFNPQSRFPDHSAESTGRVCIDTAVLSP